MHRSMKIENQGKRNKISLEHILMLKMLQQGLNMIQMQMFQIRTL